MRAPAFLAALAVAGLIVACDQGLGDVCQVNSDCESPLVCNDSTKQCQPSGSGNADADVTDARFPLAPDGGDDDGGPADAAPADAAPEPDAAPELDAAPPSDAAI